MLSLDPTFVWLPVTSYAAPSPAANPSPLTVTVPFVSAVPSYVFESVALVSVTSRLLIVSLPSSITNVTFVKFPFVFVKSVAFSSMSYEPASVPLIVASPLNVKSFSVYSGSLMLSTVYPVTVFSVPSYFSLPLFSLIVTVTSAVIGVISSKPFPSTTL